MRITKGSLPLTETKSQLTEPVAFFQAAQDQPRLAYLFRPAQAGNKSPGLFWLSGFRSDMRGAKASFIDAVAEREGRACLRFDYSGMANRKAISPRAPSASGPSRPWLCSAP